jgi:hypothetical protein
MYPFSQRPSHHITSSSTYEEGQHTRVSKRLCKEREIEQNHFCCTYRTNAYNNRITGQSETETKIGHGRCRPKCLVESLGDHRQTPTKDRIRTSALASVWAKSASCTVVS